MLVCAATYRATLHVYAEERAWNRVYLLMRNAASQVVTACFPEYLRSFYGRSAGNYRWRKRSRKNVWW